eukprot:2911889-Pyramimonas_sp.AAC.1
MAPSSAKPGRAACTGAERLRRGAVAEELKACDFDPPPPPREGMGMMDAWPMDWDRRVPP